MKKSKNKFDNMDKKIFKKTVAPSGYIAMDNYICDKFGIECAAMLGFFVNKYIDIKKIGKLDDNNGFYYLEKDRIKEIQLSPNKQRKYIKILEEFGLIKTKKKNIPPKLYIYIDNKYIKKIIKYKNSLQQLLNEKE